MHNQKVWAPNVRISQIIGEFESISIVGNSPKLLESENGHLIDSHDVVMRINDGRTDGYAKHTGEKTTIRFIGLPLKENYHKFFRELKEDSLIVTRSENKPILESLGWQGDAAWIDRYGWIMRNAFSRLSGLIELTAIPEKNPRTGILILSMLVDAMQAGKKISLFGFEIAERVEGATHFYDDGKGLVETLAGWDKFHCPMSYEFAALTNLRDRSLITIN